MLPAVAVVVGIMLLLWKFAYNENDSTVTCEFQQCGILT